MLNDFLGLTHENLYFLKNNHYRKKIGCTPGNSPAVRRGRP